MNPIAKTLMLTTQCSALCSHCPFSDPSLKRIELTLDQVLFKLENAQEDLVVLSGGEVFEYTQLPKLLQELQSKNKKRLRIATGNFIPLKNHLQILKHLPHFEGLSLGTDTLIKFEAIWFKNMSSIQDYGIPYSLTFTLLKNIRFPLEDVLSRLSRLNLNPQFIYLRSDSLTDETLIQQTQKVKDFFANFTIIEDHLNHS